MNDELRKSLDDVMEEIESIEKWISKNSMDRNTKYLIKYAVIRSCSVIETVFKKLIFNVMSDECNELVKNYLQKKDSRKFNKSKDWKYRKSFTRNKFELEKRISRLFSRKYREKR